MQNSYLITHVSSIFTCDHTGDLNGVCVLLCNHTALENKILKMSYLYDPLNVAVIIVKSVKI